MADEIKKAELELEVEKLTEEKMLLTDEYVVSAIGTMLQSLIDTNKQNIEANTGIARYDPEHTPALREGLGKIADMLKAISEREEPKPLDLKPIITLLSNFLSQNQKIMEKVSEIKEPVQDQSANRELVNGIINVIMNQNKLLERIVDSQNRMFEMLSDKNDQMLEKITEQITNIPKPKELISTTPVRENGVITNIKFNWK